MIERRTDYDPALLLTRAALAFVGYLIVFVSVIIGIQIFVKGTANTESWAALTGLIGWVTGTVGMIYNARYNTNKQSEAKDAVIAQQSRTAEAIATGTGGGAQTGPILKAENVAIDANTATVTTGEPK